MIANKVTAFHCEMVPFDVMAGGDCVISNSGSVTHLREGFKMLDLSVTTVPKRDVILVLPYLGFRSEVF